MLELSGTELHTYQPTRLPGIRSGWLWPNLLSLDAPFIAILWQQLFALSFHVSLHLAQRLALGFAAWFVYLADRILDTASPTPPPCTARHKFYAARRRPALLLAVAAFSGAALSSVFLPPVTLACGLFLAVLAAAYLCRVHFSGPGSRALVSKEVSVGVLFAGGTALAPLSAAEPIVPMLIPVLLFACLCSLNCLAIEQAESGLFAQFAGRFLSAGLACLALVCALLGPFPKLDAALAVSALGTFYFVRCCRRLPPDAARVLADLPLLFPAVFLFAR